MAHSLRTFLRYWLPLLIYVGLIFVFSSLSRRPIPFLNSVPDKLLHFIEYALLAALTARAINSLPKPNAWWLILLLTFLLVAALGVLDEFYQGTVPARESDVLDWVADAVGGLAGGVSYLLAKRWLLRRTATGN